MMLGALEYNRGIADRLAAAFKTDSSNSIIASFVTTSCGLQWVGEFNDWAATAAQAQKIADQFIANQAILSEIPPPLDSRPGKLTDFASWMSSVWKGGKGLSAMAGAFQQAEAQALAKHPLLKSHIEEAFGIVSCVAKQPAMLFASALAGDDVLAIDSDSPDVENFLAVDLGPCIAKLHLALGSGKALLARVKAFFDGNAEVFAPMVANRKEVLSHSLGPLVSWLTVWEDGLAACQSMIAHSANCEDFPNKYSQCKALCGASFPAEAPGLKVNGQKQGGYC